MSSCDIYFNKGCKGKVYKRHVDDDCILCNDPDNPEKRDPCLCPPLGEPKKLTIVAPVIFDECGINLCKVIQRDIFKKYEDAASIQLRVIGIDYNIHYGEDGSKVEFIKNRPNCIRITLSHICVKLAVKVLDDRCCIIDTFCIDELFLPCEDDPEYDEETNPSSITIDLYAPYGVSYIDTCDECIPTINFLGFIENGEDARNDDLRQGVDSQALAKVVRFDPCRGVVAIGLTIYLKVVYFIQYKIPHDGIAVPPKCEPIYEVTENACKEFVEGDLLEQNILPLALFPNDDDDCGCDDDDGDGDRDGEDYKPMNDVAEEPQGPRPRRRGF
ncbi:hypothetical protein [Vallitalea okinawensis]|uniref:hypothetical protein n=1 Tax=Vallitalea okinawensis TaxID=2078660 RepID=UPI000CFCE05D|nr:hypothetical protein [Vallitalea okinawensis]